MQNLCISIQLLLTILAYTVGAISLMLPNGNLHEIDIGTNVNSLVHSVEQFVLKHPEEIFSMIDVSYLNMEAYLNIHLCELIDLLLTKTSTVRLNKTAYLQSLYPLSRRNNELTFYFDQENTDKGPSIHNYGEYYHRYISSYRDLSTMNYLELGTLGGRSLRAFRHYFSNARYIVGIDKSVGAKLEEDIGRGIMIEIGMSLDIFFA